MNTMCFHSYKIPGVVKFIEKESRIMAARIQGEKEVGNYTLKGTEFQMERVVEIGCTQYERTEHYWTFKND